MKQRDLTTGSIKKNLLYMSLPTMGGFFIQTLYDIVDMIWIGKISLEALAGVTVFSSIFWMAMILNEIIGSSSVSLISQSYGEGDIEKTRKIVEQTITFKGLVAIIAGMILVVGLRPLATFFDPNPLVVNAAMDYGYIRAFFLPVMFSSYTVNTALRCVGDSKRPFYLMLVSAILNLVLDPILIFETLPLHVGKFNFVLQGFGLGVFGAALATVISVTIAFLLGFLLLLSDKTNVKITIKGLFTLDKKIDYKLITIGLPSGAENLNRNLSNLVILKLIGGYGSVAIAASGIGMRYAGLLIMPLIGLTMGGGAIVGQNLGVNKVDRAKETAQSAAWLGLVTMIFAIILTYIFSEDIMRLFSPSPEVIAIGIPMLRILVLSMIMLSLFFGYATVFSGSGYNMPFLYSSIAGRWIGIVFATVGVLVFKADINWIWISYVFGDIVEYFVIMYFYRKGDWQKKRVIR